ncbi:uncharacterized protein [Parasteatoda tepidariorum]|uniref:uncharacterized protein isoform X2 n=1 Tax=Parasteatoda tepidariorum TaxID=114398 RepID=UPI00077FA8F6|nr:uncharacterized protein LOC107446081 isoform X2 [Parasteatoda tepidariorum]
MASEDDASQISEVNSVSESNENQKDYDSDSSNKEEKESKTSNVIDKSEPPQKPPETIPVRRPGRKRRGQIYDKNDDPETIKEKRKKRAVELKLKNLKWTLNQPADVSGKRQKKAPQRFELVPVDKRKSCMDDCEGFGEPLGCINWIHTKLQVASIYTLRLLHRTIYRKQGMFSEKLIRKTVGKFSGFPFDGTHPEMMKRREQLEKANASSLGHLCDLLALHRASKEVMIDRIIGFLLKPNRESVEEYMKVAMAGKMQQSSLNIGKAMCQSLRVIQDPFQPMLLCPTDQDGMRDLSLGEENSELNDIAWVKPDYFVEGNGVKLKFIRAIVHSIQAASDPFIELLHRLLFLNVDEKVNMRKSILEFSGYKCEVGSNEYMYRVRILAALPAEQLKLICKVLCLPTWHKSRQLLTEAIMDFLAAPRISVMKKRVPPHFTDEITFSFDGIKAIKSPLPELKSAESEEIEIVPDIHISDESPSNLECSMTNDNEYLGVKLKHFSNIHYQVISTPAAKLSDVHMILYLTTSAQNNIRRNVLEFSGYHFDENSTEYQCRRNLMEQMSLEDLKVVATVLCVSQYIVDESKESLIEAILKFLLKPSALLNSSTIMPTISPAPSARKIPVVKKKATSTCFPFQSLDGMPEIMISKVETLSNSKETNQSFNNVNNVISCTSTTVHEDIKPDIEKVKASLSSSIQIVPLPSPDVKSVTITPTSNRYVPILPTPVKTQESTKKEDTDEPLSKVKTSVIPAPIAYFESDDEDDKPLSKMIGHPNDDQLRALVAKIIKDSRLDEITMKTVIRKVFDTYPNYDLSYRKEFIKSNVRLLLSQMDDQNCSVTTTVITI